MESPDHRPLRIGELSERTGASVRALRYYEQHGLIVAERSTAGHRRFHRDTVETVRRIRLFLDAGLPLAVVGQVLPCFIDEGLRLQACVAAHLRDRLDVVLLRARELEAQRDTLRRLQRLVAG